MNVSQLLQTEWLYSAS